MASKDFILERSIKYLNKDFVSFKRDLIDFSQAHHSGVFQDYNESSPGMAILELQAYIGDVLAFDLDMKFMELQQQRARQIENVVANAKGMGYRPAGKRAARGTQAFFVQLPAINLNGQVVPDDSYAPTLLKGAQVSSQTGVIFETLEDIAFSASTVDSPRFVTGSQFDSNTGIPTHFAVMKEVDVISGETITEDFTLGSFRPFASIELANEDVIEVISVEDSDGNIYTEVDFLAQEMVFDAVINNDPDNAVVPYILKLVSVPRRFITDRDPTTNKTSVIFGSGDGVNFDDELIPNLADLAIPLAGRRTFNSYPLDPQNFLKTRTLGLSPFNTTITVTYRVGGGAQTNVAPRTIKSVVGSTLEFSSTVLDPIKVSAIRGSLETLNMNKTEGGGAEETVSEIKANSAAFFAAQNRVVTREDYVARVMTLPSKFGKPEKVYVKRNSLNSLALDLHVLAKDENGHLTRASSNLKNNIKTYLSRFRMTTDGVNILDSDIINLRCNFGVVVSPKVSSRSEVVAKCLDVVRDYLSVDRMQIGQPIVISDLAAEIQSVFGVVSVYELYFSNVVGTVDGLDYSSMRFDPSTNTRNQILYCPENSIFEVKFTSRDIVGRSK